MLLSVLLTDSELEYATDGKRLTGIDIEEIFYDSRSVVKNGLFIAIKGMHTDSHACLSEAVEHGAVAAVVSRDAVSCGKVDTKSARVPLVIVEDCREALARIYAASYKNPQKKMKIVGVTGTNGKTTVCRMIFEILARQGFVCGLIGTTGSYISDPAHAGDDEICLERLTSYTDSGASNMTTPDPAELYRILSLMCLRNVKYVIMEVTSHSLVFSKVAPIDFEVGVFTNLTEDHLDLHNDMEGYYSAKKILFGRCRYSVVNIDDEYGRRLFKELSSGCFSCSMEGREAFYNACDVNASSEDGIEYKLTSGRLRLRIRSSIPGRMTVMNTMQAAAVGVVLGVPAAMIKDSICYLRGVTGRLERLKLNRKVNFSVYIDYAHTPDALENLLRTAQCFKVRGRRVVLLFGCGGDRETQKRAIMGRIASQMSDFFVITSDNSRSENGSDIISDIISGVTEEAHYTVIEDREAAIEYLIKNAHDGDIILLAGKGHEEYQIDMKGKRPFSEKSIVSMLVEKYYG